MKPSTKSELAINGMIELAKTRPAKPIALAHLAKKQAISLSYLEQVFAGLRRGGLVLSARGPGGGYVLARPADKISAGQIISAVDSAHLAVPSEAQHESEAENASGHKFWNYMSGRVIDLYGQITLHDIVEGNMGPVETHEDTVPQAAE